MGSPGAANTGYEKNNSAAATTGTAGFQEPGRLMQI